MALQTQPSRQSPLVLVRQSFGSLVFERCTGRYLPFDHESTALLVELATEPIDRVIAKRALAAKREGVERFYERFYERGFFTIEGHFAGEILPVRVAGDYLTGPLAVHLEVTTACNLKCRHCFAGKVPRQGRVLGMAELDRLFSEMARLGSYRLGLTGGEPLLREDLFDIIDLALAHGLSPCLTTNGTLLNEEISREFGHRELLWLNVSLEGASALTNDLIRGPGSFRRVIANLKLLAKHAKFSLAFTVMRANLSEISQCAELARQVGAQSAVFRPLYPVGNAQENLELMPTFKDYRAALEPVLGRGNGALDQDCAVVPFSPAIREERKALLFPADGCGAGNVVCSVSASGDVSPCSFLGPDFVAGNIQDRSLAELWRSPSFGHFRAAGNNGALFKRGCRARSLWLSGSVHAPDPWVAEYIPAIAAAQTETITL
jgi:mycofactocin biosynthetic radical S-adenosylmethionine protein MftC